MCKTFDVKKAKGEISLDLFRRFTDKANDFNQKIHLERKWFLYGQNQ